MLTELFPLQLAFRGLSDEDPDEITIDSPDVDEDDEDDDLPDGDDTDAGEATEPLEQ
jgi:hypothetical protein